MQAARIGGWQPGHYATLGHRPGGKRGALKDAGGGYAPESPISYVLNIRVLTL